MSDNDSDSTNGSPTASDNDSADPTGSEDAVDVTAAAPSDIPVAAASSSSTPTPAVSALTAASETLSRDDGNTQASAAATEYEEDYSIYSPFLYETATLYTADTRDSDIPLPTLEETVPLYASSVVDPATFVYDNTDPVHFYPPLLGYDDAGVVNVPMPTMEQRFYQSELVIPAADVGTVNIQFPTDIKDTDRYRLVFYPAFAGKTYNDLIPPLSKQKMEHIKQSHYLLYDTSTPNQANAKAVGFLKNDIHFYTASGWFVWQQLIKKVWSTRSTLALYVTLDDTKFTKALFSKNRHMIFHFPHHLHPKVPYTIDQAQNSRSFSFKLFGEASSGTIKELLTISQHEYVDINLDVSQKHISILFTYLIANSSGTKDIYAIAFDPVYVVQFKYLHLQGIDAVCQLECAPTLLLNEATQKKSIRIPTWTCHIPSAQTPGLYPLEDEQEGNTIDLYGKAFQEIGNKTQTKNSTFKQSFFDVQSQLIFVVNDVEPKIVYVCGWTISPINITIPALGVPVELRVPVPLSSRMTIDWQREGNPIKINDISHIEIPVNFAEDLGSYTAVFKKDNDIVLQQFFDIQLISSPMSSLASVKHGPVVESLTALVGLDKAYSVFAATYPQYYQYAVALDNLFSRYQDNPYVQLIESLPNDVMDRVNVLKGAGQHFFPPYIHYHPPLSMLPSDGNQYFVIYDTLKRQWVNLMGDESVSGMLFDTAYWPKTDMAIRSSDAQLTSTPVIDAARKSIDVVTRVAKSPFQLVDQVPVVLLSLELNQPFERVADDIAYQMGKIYPAPNYVPLVTPALQDYVKQNVVDRYLTPRQQKLVLVPNASQTDINLAARIITPSQIRTMYPSIKAHIVAPNPFFTIGSDVSMNVSRHVSSLLTSNPFDDKALIGGRIRAFTKFNPNEVTVQQTEIVNGLVQTVAIPAAPLPDVPVSVFKQASTSIVPIASAPTVISFPNRPFVPTIPIPASSTVVEIGGMQIRQATTPVATSTEPVRTTPKPAQLYSPGMSSATVVPFQRDFSNTVTRPAPQPLFRVQPIPFQRDFQNVRIFGTQASTSGTSQLGGVTRKELPQPIRTNLQKLDALVNNKLVYIPVSIDDVFRMEQPTFRPYGNPLPDILSQPKQEIHDGRAKNISDPFVLQIPRVPWNELYFGQRSSNDYDEDDVNYKDCKKLLEDYNALYQDIIERMRNAAQNSQNNTAYTVLHDIAVRLQIVFERTHALQHLDVALTRFTWNMPGREIVDEITLLNNFMPVYIKHLMEKGTENLFAPLDFETLFNAYIVTFDLHTYIKTEWDLLTKLLGGDTKEYVKNIIKEALYSFHDRPRVFVENMLKIDGVEQFSKDKSLVDFTWGTFRIMSALFSVLQILTLSRGPTTNYYYGYNLLRDIGTNGLVKYFIPEPQATLTESRIGDGLSGDDQAGDKSAGNSSEDEPDIEDPLAIAADEPDENASSSSAPVRLPTKKSIGIQKLVEMSQDEIKFYMERYTANKAQLSLQDLVLHDKDEDNEAEPTVTELFWNDVVVRTLMTNESSDDIAFKLFKRMLDDDNTSSILPVNYYASRGGGRLASTVDVILAWNEFTFHENTNVDISRLVLLSKEFIYLLNDFPPDMIRANFPALAYKMLSEAVDLPDSYLIRTKLTDFFKTFVDNSLNPDSVKPGPWKNYFVSHFNLPDTMLTLSYGELIKQIYARYVDQTRTDSVREEAQVLIAQYVSQLDLLDNSQYAVFQEYERAARELEKANDQYKVQAIMEKLLSTTPPSFGNADAQHVVVHNADEYEHQKEINMGKKAKFIENFANVPYERLRDIGPAKRNAISMKARLYEAQDAIKYLSEFDNLLDLESLIAQIFTIFNQFNTDAIDENVDRITHTPTKRYFEQQLAVAKEFNNEIQRIRTSDVLADVVAMGEILKARPLSKESNDMCREIVYARTQYLTYLDFYQRAENGGLPDPKFKLGDFNAFIEKLDKPTGVKGYIRSNLGNISQEQKEDLVSKMTKYDTDARAYTLFVDGPNPSAPTGYNTWSFEEFVGNSGDLANNLFDKSFVHFDFKGGLKQYIEETQEVYLGLFNRIKDTEVNDDAEKTAIGELMVERRNFLPVRVYRQLEDEFTTKFRYTPTNPTLTQSPTPSSSSSIPAPQPTPTPLPEPEPEPAPTPTTSSDTSQSRVVVPLPVNTGEIWQNPTVLDNIRKPNSTIALQYVNPGAPSFISSAVGNVLSMLRGKKWKLSGGDPDDVFNMDNIKGVFDGRILDVLKKYDAKFGTKFEEIPSYYARALALAERVANVKDTDSLDVDDTDPTNTISFNGVDLRMFFIAAALLNLFFHSDLDDNAAKNAFSGPTSSPFTLLLMLYPKVREYVSSVTTMGTWVRFFGSIDKFGLKTKNGTKDVFDPKVWDKINFTPFYLNDSYVDTTHKDAIENAIYASCIENIDIENVTNLQSFKASDVFKTEHKYTIQELLEPASMLSFDNSRKMGKIDLFIFFQYGWWRRISAFLGKNYQRIQVLFASNNPFVGSVVVEPSATSASSSTPVPQQTPKANQASTRQKKARSKQASTTAPTQSARPLRTASLPGREPDAFKGMQN